MAIGVITRCTSKATLHNESYDTADNWNDVNKDKPAWLVTIMPAPNTDDAANLDVADQNGTA